MRYFFHAVAIDYDGTLTEGSVPARDVLAAVRELRSSGRACLLVTGRIMAELRADFPDVDDHFDAIVAENGAVLARPGAQPRALAPPISSALENALRERGVALRRGQVILALDAAAAPLAAAEITRLGEEYQLVHNRGALMILPPAVNKGRGVAEALEELNISLHSVVSVGDAENDHSLLNATELGIAVANAVPALKAHADLVLEGNDGAGVAALMRTIVTAGLGDVEPKRWKLRLGVYDDDGSAVIVPASHVNIAVEGPSGAGKSYFAGLIAEQLIAQRYTVCVLDLEGDHTVLGGLHGALTVGGRQPLPPPRDVAAFMTRGVTSVIADLSLTAAEKKREYAVDLLKVLQQTRHAQGVPQWIIIDEAHVPLHGAQGWWRHADAESGLCVVTYRPNELHPRIASCLDYTIQMKLDGSASLATCRGRARRFTPATRALTHIRHHHKYTAGQLPRSRHFYFRRGETLTGQSAGNLPEFARMIRSADHHVLLHHASGRDFSRWLRDLSQHKQLTHAVRALEEEAAFTTDTETLRIRLLAVLASYFGGQPAAQELPAPVAVPDS